MNPAQPVYNLRQVAHYYKEVKALEVDTLSIDRGTITGLIGPNGSGKSTLLRLLTFAERPSRGKIFFDGQRAHPFSAHVRSRVTLLPQEPYLLKRNVYDNVAYGMKLRGERTGIAQRIEKALADVGLSFEKFAHRRWYELSGGEAQRTAMAARLILNPAVLLLDEPTANVDAESAKLIRDAALCARQERGTTLVISSHDWHWLYEICDDLLHLYKGTVFESGMENIITGPWQKKTADLYYKAAGESQKIYVPPPPSASAAALIPKDHIRITPAGEAPPDTDNTLSGTVTRMILEKRSMKIVATIMTGDIYFTIRLSGKEVHRLNLYPGTGVVLSFGKESVAWL